MGTKHTWTNADGLRRYGGPRAPEGNNAGAEKAVDKEITLSAPVSGAGSLVGADTLPPTSAPVSAVGAAGALTGTYYYGVAYLLDDGTVTPPWPGDPASVVPASQRVNLTGIPVSPSSRVVGRVLLRTKVNPPDLKAYYVLTTINDNSTTTYTDNAVDGDLTTPADWLGTVGGRLTTSSGVAIQGLASQSQSLTIGGGSAAAGYASVALGYGALSATTIGRRNTAVGVYAGTSATTGFQNTLVGVHAGQELTVSSSNVFIGYTAGWKSGTTDPTKGNNVAVGTGALYGTTTLGSNNVAIGFEALGNINTADQCIGIGFRAGKFANAPQQVFIDNATRADLAACQNIGLVYGKCAATAAAQDFRINSNTRIGAGDAPVVSGLPAASAAYKGYRGYVTDASVAYTSANVGSTVAGGGANCVPVFCNGTNWVIG